MKTLQNGLYRIQAVTKDMSFSYMFDAQLSIQGTNLLNFYRCENEEPASIITSLTLNMDAHILHFGYDCFVTNSPFAIIEDTDNLLKISYNYLGQTVFMDIISL